MYNLIGPAAEVINIFKNASEMSVDYIRRTLNIVYSQKNALLLMPSGYLVWAYIEILDTNAYGKWRRLPAIVRSALEDDYNIDLSNVIYADNINTIHDKAITFENRIYFPRHVDILNNPSDLHWMLHELEHVRQYKVRGGLIPFLITYLVQGALTILENGSINIHDEISLEKEAEDKANFLYHKAIERIQKSIVLSESSQSPPALVNHDGRLFLAWRGKTNDRIHLSSSIDGYSFTRLYGAYQEVTGNTPAMASFNGELYIAWLSNDLTNRRIHLAYSKDGTSFSTSSGLYEQTTVDVPALTEFNGQLYAGWRGGDSGNHRIHLARSRDGKQFSSLGGLYEQTTRNGLTMTSFKGRLYVSWRGETNNYIYIATSDNGENFSVYRLNESTKATPYLFALRSQIYLSWQAENASNKIHISSSKTGQEGEWTGAIVLTASSGTPALSAVRGNLVCAWLEPDEGARLAITKPGALFRLVIHRYNASAMFADKDSSPEDTENVVSSQFKLKSKL